MPKHEEFIARNGAPKTMVSDRGCQLVSAGRVLTRIASKGEKVTQETWDWSKITRENALRNWTFVPIGSQHFKGLPESRVKVLKKKFVYITKITEMLILLKNLFRSYFVR